MIRKTRPTSKDKYFIRKASGGFSTCIQGKPTDSRCDVLANCVGYACGAFNEELDLGYEKYHLNCNAENFIERAIASGLSVVKKPCVGSIICWKGKGSLAGHVAIVIEVINDNCIKTAESGWGAKTPFWITTRYNNNGRWGMNSNYPVRGFIVNPNYPVTPTPTPTPTHKFKLNDKVIINGPLYKTANDTKIAAVVKNKVTIITRVSNKGAHPYNFTGDLGWADEKSLTLYEKSEIKVGDIVTVSGKGCSNSKGAKPYTKSYNKKTMKVIIINKGAAYPYACNQNGVGTPGNASYVTGWFAAKDVKK